MKEIKKFIVENKFLVILFVFIIVSFIGIAIYNHTRNERIYETQKPDGSSYVKKEYDANEYRPVTIELIDLLNEYYKFFIKKQINTPEEAYALLSQTSKERFNNDYQEYLKYVKDITTINSIKNEIKEYRINSDNKHIYEIIDTEDNKYAIHEKAVWDIEISINGKR